MTTVLFVGLWGVMMLGLGMFIGMSRTNQLD